MSAEKAAFQAVDLDTPGLMPHIGHLWAYLAVDRNGNEGVVGVPVGNGTLCMPAIGADETRIKSLAPMIEKIAIATGRKVRLVKFSVREDLREITGRPDA